MPGKNCVYKVLQSVHVGILSSEGMDYWDRFQIELPSETPLKEVIRIGDYQARGKLISAKHKESSLREGNARRSQLVVKTEKGREIRNHLTETGRML
jgi:hypothetical protein